jgi:hypothetical protein
MLGVLFSIVGAFAIGGLALDEGLCQRHANNTLEYCPPGTVLVGKGQRISGWCMTKELGPVDTADYEFGMSLWNNFDYS